MSGEAPGRDLAARTIAPAPPSHPPAAGLDAVPDVPIPPQSDEPRPVTLRATLADVGLLALFWLLTFWGVLVTRRYLIPYDLLDQHYMFQAFVHRALATGASPFWTPNILAGYPIAADPLTALFYPPNLLMHLLARGPQLPYLFMEWQAALHVLWAAIGSYFLGRALSGSQRGGLLAGLVFAFGSFFAWHVPHLSPISTLSWLPWILLAYRRLIRERNPAWAAVAALLVGMMALAGHALSIVMIGYLLVGLTSVVTVREWRTSRRAALRLAVLGLLPLALGAGIAAIQLAPSLSLSQQTSRTGLDFSEATGASFLPHYAVTMLVPNFFSYTGPAAYWAGGDIAETNGYIGLLPLFLAALALARARRVERLLIGALATGALIAAAFAFGPQTWAYRLGFDLLPALNRVRRPVDFLALLQLALGLLAAGGIALLERQSDGGPWRLLDTWLRRALLLALLLCLAACGGLVAAQGTAHLNAVIAVVNGLVVAGLVLLAAFLIVRACLRWRMPASLALSALLLLVAFDLGSATSGKVWQDFRRGPESYIGADWAGATSDPAVRALLADEQPGAPGASRMLPVNAGSIWLNGPLVWNLQSAQGYSVLWPTYYQEYLNAAMANPNSPLLSLLGVRDVLSSDPLDKALPGAAAGSYRQVSGGQPAVYRAESVSPRAWYAPNAVRLASGAELGYLMAHPEHTRDTITLIEPPPASSGGDVQAGDVQVTAYVNDRVSIHAVVPRAGFVVLDDTYFPGWNATVDGRPAHVNRADHAFRAVWVDAGTHDIDLHFTLPGLKLGAGTSGLSLLGTLVLGVAPLASQRRRCGRRGALPSDNAR